MTGAGERLPSARVPKPIEERIRLVRDELPKLWVEAESACQRARVRVGHGRKLVDARLAWDALAEELEFARGQRNEPLGHITLARIVETAVRAALGGYEQKVAELLHEPPPTKAQLEDSYYDEYWRLPEHARPDTPEEYVKDRIAAEGPTPTPGQQRRADEAAARERIKADLTDLGSLDPARLRVSEPWMTDEAAQAKERYAEVVRKLQSFDPAAVRGVGRDSRSDPQVVVTVALGAPFALELGPRVWSSPGSKLGPALVKAHADALADHAAQMAQNGLVVPDLPPADPRER